jgi:hypothetical protein
MRNIHVLTSGETISQNICITNDEEIKEGDWYINTFVSEREQKPQTHTEKRHLINHQKDYRFKYCKKIILTDIKELIKDGVQAIDDEFLEWFVKNPSCDKVETYSLGIQNVETGESGHYKYEIIIPQKEPCLFCEGTGQVVSSTTISGFKTCDCINIPQEEPNLENLESISSTELSPEFQQLVNDNWDYLIGDEPKQETLEEAAERYFKELSPDISFLKAVEFGAKWQAERMFSSLSQLRNELYDKLPTGDVDAFELLKLIKIHLQKLDDLCGNK